MTVAPTITWSRKKRADAQNMGDRIAGILNWGLTTAAAVHLVVLGPIYAAGRGGPYLPYLLGLWSLALLAGAIGILTFPLPENDVESTSGA